MRRRFILYKDQLPKLVKLTSNPGIDQNYTIENGYRYFDLLVVGGGGAGGAAAYGSGGNGGASGHDNPTNGTNGGIGAGGGGGGGMSRKGGKGGQGIICLYYHN
jgi:hypothetical protein